MLEFIGYVTCIILGAIIIYKIAVPILNLLLFGYLLHKTEYLWDNLTYISDSPIKIVTKEEYQKDMKDEEDGEI